MFGFYITQVIMMRSLWSSVPNSSCSMTVTTIGQSEPERTILDNKKNMAPAADGMSPDRNFMESVWNKMNKQRQSRQRKYGKLLIILNKIAKQLS